MCALILATVCCQAGCCNPRDLVTVSIEGAPHRLNFVAVVGQEADRTLAFDWYVEKLGWGTMRVYAGWISAAHDFSALGRHALVQPVQWVESNRYAVLIRLPDRSWVVWWFDTAEVPLENRSWFCGGGHAHFDLRPPRKPEVVDDAVVRGWGIPPDYLDEFIEPALKREREWEAEKNR